MAVLKSIPTERKDHTKEITGNRGIAVSQDSNGQLESVLQGSQGTAISQDANDRLESVLVGGEDIPIDQEPGSGKAVMRLGGKEKDTDVNVGTKASPRDLIGDGDFASGARNTGGAEAIAGEFTSDSGNTFNVEIDWLDSNENVVLTHSPSAGQGVTDFEFAWRVRSDRWELRVEDASGAATNNVRGSANVH